MYQEAIKEKPLVVILMGPPGAGKGTQATALTEHIAIPHISTGDLFRENIGAQTAVGKLAKTYIDKGQLVPDQIVLDMLFARILQPDCKKGYILDGFPRTVVQAEALDKNLGAASEVVILNLNVPDMELFERITGRLVCKSCSKLYHQTHRPPQKENQCDACGGTLYQRADDTVSVFTHRLKVYRTQTAPLIDYYTNKKLLRQIYPARLLSEVTHQILEALPQSLSLN